MKPGQILPPFTLCPFMKTVAKGIEKRRHTGSNENVQKKNLLLKKRQKRDEQTAFWTTPGARPLAEPPILEWDYLLKSKIPSDLRYRALFPDNPEHRAAMKDLFGERLALAQYLQHAHKMMDCLEPDLKRHKFYENLAKDLDYDFGEVDDDVQELYTLGSDVGVFEFMYLDNDGKTTWLEKMWSKGADVLRNECDEVREKYKHLAPTDFVENPVGTYEFQWLDSGDGGTDSLEARMRQGKDALNGQPDEVQRKYGHLRRLLPPPHHMKHYQRLRADGTWRANGT